MKNIDPDLQLHLDGTTTTLCTCWHVTREDGVEYGFTDHDKDLTIDAQLYKAATGFTATSVESKADFSVDNMDLEGMLSSGATGFVPSPALRLAWHPTERRCFTTHQSGWVVGWPLVRG